MINRQMMIVGPFPGRRARRLFRDQISRPAFRGLLNFEPPSARFMPIHQDIRRQSPALRRSPGRLTDAHAQRSQTRVPAITRPLCLAPHPIEWPAGRSTHPLDLRRFAPRAPGRRHEVPVNPSQIAHRRPQIGNPHHIHPSGVRPFGPNRAHAPKNAPSGPATDPASTGGRGGAGSAPGGKRRTPLPDPGRGVLFDTVARGGVEPPTYRFSGGRSYQLSYLAVLLA